jgi:hypothetical protein
MRGALVSVAVGLAGAAAVTAGTLGILHVLPEPGSADHVAAEAESWFHYYRLTQVVFHSRHHRSTGACLGGWYLLPPTHRPNQQQPHHRARQPHRLIGYGSALAFSDGPVALVTARHLVRQVFGRRHSDLPASLAAAIGCTSPLANALTAAVEGSGRLSVERAYAANQPALALELRTHGERLTVYVSPRGYRPLVVLGALGGQIATSRIYLTHLTRARAANFDRVLRAHGLLPPQRGGRRSTRHSQT